ncbi:Type 1 glutamine amidotransferase-like domain-containing protein [Arthrobacter woluwensis]|uniref:Type 1 glutamine amidotransferase-like domain-containing protein n=1 Tax=Arthrobacter woluwensis TaxID=156980 RepID=UPI0011A1B3C7|nr:peptidase E [Arthrobacter woluwensis]
MRGTIVTLGGGGFSMSEDGASLIDDQILDLSGTSRPKVCFVPTASGDDGGYIRRFEDAFRGRATTSVLSLFCRDPWGYTDPAMLLDQEVVYVGGGSTVNLLELWRRHGVAELMAQAAAQGTVLAGISAGMNCWYEASSTDSFGPLAPLNDGLGLLRGSACPHYRGEPGRRERYLGWVADGSLPTGYAVDDYAALLFRDGELSGGFAERPGSQAFRVELDAGSAVEREIPLQLLS